MKLTNGTETFQITEQSDELGPATGFDSKGSTYARCDIGACDHEHAPAGAKVWHDDSHTEELWEVRESEGSERDRADVATTSHFLRLDGGEYVLPGPTGRLDNGVLHVHVPGSPVPPAWFDECYGMYTTCHPVKESV